ncbi:MAG: hypothetical protein ACLR1R_12820 [Ruminococcus callidus]
MIEQKEPTATTQHGALVFYALVEIQRLPLQKEKSNFFIYKKTPDLPVD